MAKHRLHAYFVLLNYNRQPSVDDNVKYTIKVVFHFVNDDSGNHLGNAVGGEALAMQAITYLNINFNPYNIFFKYKGFDIVNNSVATSTASGNNVNGIFQTQNLNIFFVNNAAGASGLAYFGSPICWINWQVPESSVFDEVISHEVGHCLRLYHTYWSFNTCEHVTRDTSDPNYNADVEGDLVEDTAAEGLLAASYDTDCQYNFIPNYIDCQGTPYQDIVSNIMSGGPYTCPSNFTWGQARRMRAFLANLTSNWYNVLTTTDELYEPFETSIVAGPNVVSVTDNGDGTAKVCRNMLKRHRFQRSFNYGFTDTWGGDPVSATTDDLPSVQENTYKFGVTIMEVDPSVTKDVDVDCTRGVVCTDETFIGGKIITTEVLGSLNMTTKDLTQMEAKDPKLFDTLMSERYHIITLKTVTGAEYQVVIYKE